MLYRKKDVLDIPVLLALFQYIYAHLPDGTPDLAPCLWKFPTFSFPFRGWKVKNYHEVFKAVVFKKLWT